ncbi:MAG: exonuclease domain-containing protein [Actinomycetota bacterium]|nr:exonuclease domain-containing protein [Actinomycetota bacterium]
MSWHDGRLAAFDIETTGTDTENDRIVTAAISLVGGGAERVSLDWLVNPGIEIPAEATEVHKVTNELVLTEGRPAGQAIEEITAVLAGQLVEDIPIVAFNARFDLTILDREARRHGVEPLVDRVGGSDGLLVIDPYVLDKQFNKYRAGRRTLSVLCEAYGIPLTDAHAADADALAAARLAWVLGKRNEELGTADLPMLHEEQVDWALTQAAELEEYFASKGRPETIEGAWPIVPPTEIITLGGTDAIAA